MSPTPSPVHSRRTDPNKPTGPDWWLMTSRFFKHGTTIASFAPSSKYLARATIGGIDFESARCIVELGAGTGPITAEILRRARPNTKVVVVELMPEFCDRLRAKFPAADIVEGDQPELVSPARSQGSGVIRAQLVATDAEIDRSKQAGESAPP